MRRRNLATVAILLGACAVAGAAESVVTLTPAPDEPRSPLPYQMARLSVTNRGEAVVGAVSVQDVRGGLTVLRPATIAPGATETIVVPLLAFSTQQTFRVQLLAGPEPGARVLFEARPLVAWPGEIVEATLAALLDAPAYDHLAGQSPLWPADVRLNILGLAALAALLLVATMFIHRPALRLGALFLLIAAATLAAALALRAQELLVVRDSGPRLAVSARRTIDWSEHYETLVPLYAVKSQLTSDTAILGPGYTLRTTIRPDSPRLFARLRAP